MRRTFSIIHWFHNCVDTDKDVPGVGRFLPPPLPIPMTSQGRIQGGGARGPGPPFMKMHSIDFYSGSRKKTQGGSAIRNPKKNHGTDFYSGFRKTSQGGCNSNS